LFGGEKKGESLVSSQERKIYKLRQERPGLPEGRLGFSTPRDGSRVGEDSFKGKQSALIY